MFAIPVVPINNTLLFQAFSINQTAGTHLTKEIFISLTIPFIKLYWRHFSVRLFVVIGFTSVQYSQLNQFFSSTIIPTKIIKTSFKES